MSAAGDLDDLRELYQQVIIDHSRSPRNRGTLADADRVAEGHNPLCGDRVRLMLKLGANGGIEAAQFVGEGCAISTAAASVMTEAVVGLAPETAQALGARFRRVVMGEAAATELAEDGKLLAFAGVAAFPSRVKCATLAWHALDNALAERDDLATSE